MLERFLPQTVPFFKLLMEQNAVLQRMAQSLIVVMENTYESEGHLKQINILEEEADKLNRKITWHLSQTFILFSKSRKISLSITSISLRHFQ